MLEPGQKIRPRLSRQEAVTMVRRLYGLEDVTIEELNGYDDKNYHVQICAGSKKPQIWPHGYVLKVTNSLDSEKLPLVEGQIEIALYLGTRGINCPQPVKNLSGNYYSLEELTHEGVDRKRHVVRMLTYQPGQLLNTAPCTQNLMFKVGKFLGQMDRVLRGFRNPAYDNAKSIWSLECAPSLTKFTFAVKDVDKNDLVNKVIDAFGRDVLPIVHTLEKGMIHGDFNDQNVVVGPDPVDGSWDVTAVLDFGDTQLSCYVFELAITVCYVMLLASDLNPLDAAGHVIAGYSMVRPLPDVEFNILKVCVSARLCQSLVMGAYSYQQDPKNEYLIITSQRGWNVLRLLWNTPQSDLINRWRKTVPLYKT
ncbi:hydroxylysine kinase isoform X1 [Zootermopsis nevadensis]|nr:hydroxylysine kinase isoform X1 [Zootermopsis nevadensis]